MTSRLLLSGTVCFDHWTIRFPRALISNGEQGLDLLWSYGHRFCCEQLFRDQKSGVYPLAGRWIPTGGGG